MMVYYILTIVLCLFFQSSFLLSDILSNNGKGQSDQQQDYYDPKEPLLLTSYLERGLIKEAKHLARVSHEMFLGVESYSGYMTIDKNHGSNTFFWFFPAMNGNASDAPLILLLSGGPGSSIIDEVFGEKGAFVVTDADTMLLTVSNNSWAHNHSLLFIDNPMGTGFSFTNSPEGLATSSDQSALQVHTFLRQFFQLFPEYLKNDFYVWGVSYAGHFAPATARRIHEERSNLPINLKGLIVEAGWTDPYTQASFGQHFYQLGLIEGGEVLGTYLREEEEMREHIRNSRWVEATMGLSNLLFSGPNSTFSRTTGLTTDAIWHYIQDEPNSPYNLDQSRIFRFLKSPKVRSAFHVGWIPVNFENSTVQYTLFGDIMSSRKPDVELLLEEGYRVLYYAGQMDLFCNPPGIENFLKNLTWRESQAYKDAPRTPWSLEDGGHVVGYLKTTPSQKLIYIFLRNAGHNVSYFQPRLSNLILNMFTKRGGNSSSQYFDFPRNKNQMS